MGILLDTGESEQLASDSQCFTTDDSISSTKVSPHIYFVYPFINFAYELCCYPLHFCDIRL